MSSTRCPGKVLRVAGGKPLLGWLLDGLAGTALDIRVATSTDVRDDPIAEYCRSRGTACFRGPLEDVTLRLLQASRGHSSFVRLCADSPLLCRGAVERAIGFAGKADLVSNVPAEGNSVEVIKRSALEEAYPHMSDEEREHVTLYFYRNEGRFRIKRFRSEPSILVDTENDWREFERRAENW